MIERYGDQEARGSRLSPDEYAEKRDFLHFKKTSFHKKVEETANLLKKNLEKYENPVLSWSGGKDSTTMLHLALQADPDIKVVHVKQETFPCTPSYIQDLAEERSLNLDFLNPLKDPLEMLEKLENLGAEPDNPVSDEEREELATNFNLNSFHLPMRRFNEEFGADLSLRGVRAEESKGRKMNFATRGHLYRHKEEGIDVLQPLAKWTVRDVWAYLAAYEVPVNPLYGMTKYIERDWIREGTWTASLRSDLPQSSQTAIFKTLRHYFPKHFGELVKRFPKLKSYGQG